VTIAFFLFALFTPAGRKLTVCQAYHSAQQNLLIDQASREQAGRVLPEILNRTPIKISSWMYLPVKHLTIPLLPGEWKLNFDEGSPQLTFISKEKNVVILSDETTTTVPDFEYLFPTDEIASGGQPTMGDVTYYLSQHNLAQPCDPRKSFKTIMTDTLFLPVKLMTPTPHLGGRMGHLPYGVTTVWGAKDQRVLIDTSFYFTRRWYQLTYALTSSEYVDQILDQLGFVVKASDMPQSEIPFNNLEEAIKRTQL